MILLLFTCFYYCASQTSSLALTNRETHFVYYEMAWLTLTPKKVSCCTIATINVSVKPCGMQQGIEQDPTNPRDAFRDQPRSPNSSIPYVRYSFLLCNSNFVRRAVFTIFDFKKCRDLEIRVRGHSRSLKEVPFGRSCMVSYQCSLVTLSIKRAVFEIFDLYVYSELETRVRGHSRSSKMIPLNPAPMTTY